MLVQTSTLAALTTEGRQSTSSGVGTDIAITPNDTEIIRVKASGKVGVMTNDPQSALDVNGTYSKSGVALFLDMLRTGYAGTATQVLTSNGINSTPTWQDATSGLTQQQIEGLI